MITYAIAKQLEKRGFKFDVPVTEANEKYLEYPSFSELIKVCGGKARMLLNKGDGSGWSYAIDGKGATGNTPEEAVTKLLLKLNKK